MKIALIGVGGLAVIAGIAGPNLLPSLPTTVQTNQDLQPVGAWIINNGTYLAIFGAILILFSFIWM
jgi:hypothetical protein